MSLIVDFLPNFYTYIIFAILVLIVIYKWKKETRRPCTIVDLPKWNNLPYFGCYFWLGKHPHITLAKAARESFDNKIFIAKAGQREYVIFTDYEETQFIVKNYPEELFGKPKSFTTGLVTLGAHNDSVDNWKTRRGFTNAGIKHLDSINHLNDIITEVVQDMMVELQRFSDEGADKVPIDIRHDVTYDISRIMHQICYGVKLDEMSAKMLKDIVHTMPDYTTCMGSFSTFDMFPCGRILQPNKFKKFVDFNQKLKKFCLIEKGKSMSKKNENRPNDNMAQFLQNKTENKKSVDKIQHEDVPSVIYEGLEDIVRAGTESTSLTFQWFLLYASKYPYIQEKMQKEIDDLLARKNTNQLDLKYYDDLPYCQAAIAETLRFCSLNPFLKRELTGDIVTRDGVLLPTGTMLTFNIWDMNFDESFWKQPFEFRPERFLDLNGQMDSGVLDHLMSFGFGKRQCIGMQVGKFICHFAAVNIMHKFNLKPESSTCDVDIESINGIGLSPKPFKVILEKRLVNPN